MAERRFVLLIGDVTRDQGAAGIGRSTASLYFPGTGDYISASNRKDVNWLLYQGEINSPIGPYAFIFNHTGTASDKAAPVESVQRLAAVFPTLATGQQPNQRNDIRNGGDQPSDFFGIEVGLAAEMIGRPLAANESEHTDSERLDPFCFLQQGSFSGILPREDAGLVGFIFSIAGTTSSPTVTITLSGPHGITPGGTRTIFLDGLQAVTGASDPAIASYDRQLIGRHRATADATNPNVLTITLPSNFSGSGGFLPSGFVVVSRMAITSITEGGGRVRIECDGSLIDPPQRLNRAYGLAEVIGLTAPSVAVSGLDGSVATRGVCVAGVTGTVDDINGHKSRLRENAQFATVYEGNLLSSASGTNTLSISSGSWDETPPPGTKIVLNTSVAGGGAGGPIHTGTSMLTVVSATANTIVVQEAILTRAADAVVWRISRLDVLEFDGTPDLTGWNGDGDVVPFDIQAAFGEDIPGSSFSEAKRKIAAAVSGFRSVIGTLGPTFAGSTVVPHAIIGKHGESEIDLIDVRTATTIEAQVFATSFDGVVREAYGRLREIMEEECDPRDDGLPCPIVLVNYSLEANVSDALTTANGQTTYRGGQFAATAELVRRSIGRSSQLLPRTILYDPQKFEHVGERMTSGSLLDCGIEIGQLLRRVHANTTDNRSLSNAAPLYILIGQSQTAGTVSFEAFQNDEDPDLDGGWYDANGVLQDQRDILIWNHDLQEFEESAPQINAQTLPTATKARHPTVASNVTIRNLAGQAGPEQTLLLELRKKHPRVFLLKMAVGSSSLQVNATSSPQNWDPDGLDLYSDLLHQFDNAVRWLQSAGYYVDLRAFIYDQGEGDANPDLAGTYGAALTQFIQRVREDFQTTSTSRAPLPFVIGKLQTHDRLIFDLPSANVVRAAQESVANTLPNVAIADMDGLPIARDGIHRTYRGFLEAGSRLAGALERTSIGQDAPDISSGVNLNPEFANQGAGISSFSGGSSLLSVIGFTG